MASKQRVVVATRLYTPEVTAASFRMEALAKALADNAEVTVLTTRPPRGVGEMTEPDRIRVRRMPVLRDRTGAIRGYLQYLSFDIPLFFRLMGTRAEVIVAEAPPTTGLVAAVVGTITRRPLVYYPGDVWSDAVASTGAPRIVTAVMAALERFVLRRSAHSIAVSEEVAQRFVALGADPARVSEVGNGIDTSVFHPGVPAPDVERPYFVYTGTMSEWQQPDIFIRALASLDPGVELRFFGQGAVQSELEALAAELVPGRVHFGGLVPPNESASWIRGAVAALVSIVPDIGYDFARPTKTYAAAAVGTPVLFAGARTGADVVRQAELGIATDFTVDAVADAMRTLLEQSRDGSTEQRRAERSKWAVETVSWRTVGKKAASVVTASMKFRRARRR